MNKDYLRYKNPEKRKEYMQKWREDNKGKVMNHYNKWRLLNWEEYHKNNKDKLRLWWKTMQEKYPEKFKARYALRWAVRSGRIKKPENCKRCYSTNKLQGHHNNYTKPLEVDWLCQKCHTVKHHD